VFARFLVRRDFLAVKKGLEVSIERNYEGAYVISDIVGGYLVTRRYYGYTKKEAIALFKSENY
jgi:hypothetical protein